MSFEYTVKDNDRGLSYIFLEQAKKQAGFDGSKNIDWNKVCTVFDEIQKEKVSNGDRLFFGGTDKTEKGYGTSYQIRAGQKISLSDEQMNKIYGAMGLNLSAAVQKDENIPTQTKPAPAFVSSITDEQITRSYVQYQLESGEIIKCPKDVQYDDNGREVASIIRNPDGSIREYYEFEYDDKGNKSRDIFRKPNGDLDWYRNHEYNDSGKLIRTEDCNADGQVTKVYNY